MWVCRFLTREDALEEIHKENETWSGDNRLSGKWARFPKVDEQSTDGTKDSATQMDSHSMPNLPPPKVAYLNKGK